VALLAVVGELTLTYETMELGANPGLTIAATPPSPARGPSKRSACSRAGPHRRTSLSLPAHLTVKRRAMPAPEREPARGDEHEVTPLELFFDLVFVFAITQVTKLLTSEPTSGRLLRGMLVLAAVWWAWTTYAWLTSAIDVDEGAVRLTMLASTAIMLGVALAVPRAFGADAVLFGVAYLLVRLIHFALSALVGRDDPARRGVLLRFAPTAIVGRH
jgi:low temperature requirement protein LtrA